jgi:bacterioferritin
MLRDPVVIEHLNTQLTNELTAINQYFCMRARCSIGV